MITTHALLILATHLSDANTFHWALINLMTTMHAQEISAQLTMELNTFQLFVITQTNVQLDLVTLLKDANTPTKFVTITMHAQLILAQTDNASSLLLFANNKIARPFLATKTLENASMLMSIVTTAMHVPLTAAI
jgi:hypothetical protein